MPTCRGPAGSEHRLDMSFGDLLAFVRNISRTASEQSLQ